MGMDRPPRISLATLVDLSAQTARDKAIADLDLRRRDRAIGQRLQRLRDRPAMQIAAWLDRVDHGSDPMPGPGVARASGWAAALLGLIGFGLGWGSAVGVFWYDGTHPVNIIAVLAAYVALPLLLLIPTGAAMLPLGPAAASALRTLSPGRLLGVIARRLPMEQREPLEDVLGHVAAHGAAFGKVQKWLVLAAAQAFAVAFFAGALLGALRLIVFSDLAFGWSTTLQVDPPQMTTLVNTLAWPWGAWWSDAKPNSELVALTRYFRAAPELPDDAAALGQWWPFLIACMVSYALLPRVVLFALSVTLLQRSLNEAIEHAPGAARLLDRLNHELIETRGEGDEPAEAQPEAGQSAPLDTRQVSAVINWSSFPAEDDRLSRQFGATVQHAGGAATLEEDERVAAQAADAVRAGGGAILIVVKAWEPPTMELADFAQDLRQAVGQGVSIVVVPAGEELTPAEPGQVDQWRRALARQGDPWLSVALSPPSASTEAPDG